MAIWARYLLATPVLDEDEKQRIAGLINTILLSFVVVGVILAALSAAAFRDPVPLMLATFVVLLRYGALFLMRRGYVQPVGIALVSIVWLTATVLGIAAGGVLSIYLATYMVVIVMAGLVLGSRAGILFAGLSLAASLGMLYAGGHGLLDPSWLPATPFNRWMVLGANLAVIAVLAHLAVRSIRQAMDRSESYAAELTRQQEHLEEVVEERTRDLTRRARYLETTSEVARETASELDLDRLLTRVAALVSTRFGFYHTGIFLLDDTGEWAVLRAASSEGGQRMLARHHQLRLGVGIVGYATDQAEPRVALDVGQDAVFFDNPDLPETRSELALPLKARGNVIGALDVQSSEPGAFSQEDIAVLQIMADQIALAISNAQLFQQARESVEAERRAYGQSSRQAWKTLLHSKPDLGVVRNKRGLFRAGDLWRPEMATALRTQEPTVVAESATGTSILAMPIAAGGQVVGVIEARRKASPSGWLEADIALMATLTEQLGIALEGARLYREAQRRAVEEQMISEVAVRMRETLDVDTVLQSAIQEMGSALGITRVEVRLGQGVTQPEDARQGAEEGEGNAGSA
jgi:GAF domain-containing protein